MSADEICITIVEGRNLAIKDSCGTSDPYVKVKLGTEKYKTKKIMKNLNPRWNEKCYFKAPGLAACTLQITVWDWDRIGTDDYMGEVRIPMSEVMVLGEINKWYPLECGPEHQGEQVSGEINVRVQVMVQGDLQTGNLNAEELRRFAMQKMSSHVTLPGTENGGSDAAPPLPPREEGYESSDAVTTRAAPSAPFTTGAPAGFGHPRSGYSPSPTSYSASMPAVQQPAFASQPRTGSIPNLNAGPAPPPPQVKPPGMAPPRRQGSQITMGGAPAAAPRAAPPPPPPQQPALPQAKALYAWTAENPGELASLAVGEIVSVKDSSDASWWMVVDARGNEGYVASNYIALI